MNIEKIDKDTTPGLYAFIKLNLHHSSLSPVKWNDGYGHSYGVKLSNEKSLREFFGFEPKGIVARIDDGMIELFYPEYFSDFELICKKYEEKYGKEVTLRYWE